MKLSSDSITAFSNITLGNTGLTSKLNKSEVDELLKTADLKSLSYNDFFKDYPNIASHSQYNNQNFKLEQYFIINLKNINYTHKIYKVVDAYFSQLFNYTSSIAEVLEYINAEFSKDNYEVVQMEETGELKIYSLDDSMVNYDCIFKEKEIGNYILINQQCDKCIKKIESGDYMGAITNASSLLEQLLQEIILDQSLKKKVKYNYQLKDFMRNVLKQLNIGDNSSILQHKITIRIRSGFINLVDGISLMRNNMSDAHRVLPEVIPTKKESLLAVNTAKTIANFIVAEYFEKFGDVA